MKNITLDRATVLQLDPDGTDRALDAAANCDVLRNDAALNLCALADQEIRGAQLALDSAEDLRWTIAFDVADDRHAGADARACSRFRRRLRPRPGLFNDRVLLLHRPFHDFCRICRRVILLRCLTLEATQHVHLPFSSACTAGKGQGCLLAFERELAQSLYSPRGETLRLGRHLRTGLRKRELPPRWRVPNSERRGTLRSPTGS